MADREIESHRADSPARRGDLHSGLQRPDGGLFIQETKGFLNDVALLSVAQVGFRAAGLQTLARLEVILLAGVACGASSAALAASLTLSAVEFAGEHHQDIPRWTRAMGKVLAAPQVLKRTSPTRLSVIEDKLFQTTMSALAEATVYNEDFIAQSIGVTIGVVGSKAYSRKISVASVLFSTLAFICGRAFSAATPSSICPRTWRPMPESCTTS